MLPMANNGSEVIYHRVIKPFVKKHEKEFDSAFDAAGGLVKDAAGKGDTKNLQIEMCWLSQQAVSIVIQALEHKGVNPHKGVVYVCRSTASFLQSDMDCRHL